MGRMIWQKFVLSGCLVFFTSISAQAKVLLVSDIDDTLKISHVLDSWDAVQNVIAPKNHFLGMSELFKIVGLKQETVFAYVSNADAIYMQWPHENFLSYNYFPAGGVYLQESGDENHKLNTISRLIEEQKPDLVIMIGDNGQRDPVIYKQIEEKYPQLQFRTWIHQVYSVLASVEGGQPLLKKQRGFSTSIDLALDMKAQGLIADNQWLWHLQTFVPRILQEPVHLTSGELAYPQWMDCRDYLKQHNDDELTMPQPAPKLELQIQYEWKMKARCANRL